MYDIEPLLSLTNNHNEIPGVKNVRQMSPFINYQVYVHMLTHSNARHI